MARAPGLEPGSSAWKAEAQPIYQARMFIQDNHGKGTSRESVRDRIRRASLFRKQHGNCHWCSEKMSMDSIKLNIHGELRCNDAFATFEHVIPKSMGGTRRHPNLVLAHASCNRKRHKRRWPHDPIYGKVADGRGLEPRTDLTPAAV